MTTEAPPAPPEGRSADEDELKAKAAAAGNGKPEGDEKPVSHEGGDAPGEGEGESAPVISLEIPGEGQLTLTVGGTKPETSTVKLVGGKMDISGGDFDKGAPVNILIKGVVTEVSFIDSYDQYGNIKGTERRHKVRPFGVERITD